MSFLESEGQWSSIPNRLLTSTTHEFCPGSREIASMEIAKSAERIEKLMILHHGG